jgi:tetratricopeptide (TPR) repeat protein
VNEHLQRGLLLYEQSRFEMAEAEIRQSLAADPHDGFAHALLALCLAQRKQWNEATQEAQQGVHEAPDLPFTHYALASVWFDRNYLDEANRAIFEAIRLDPSDPDFQAMLAQIRFQQSRWQEALEAAERGLQIDGEHIGCTNLRAMALVKLGRKQEAGQSIEAALAKNPENSITHANQGWTWLEKGEPDKALEHFREALRLDPENEWARQGIVEALKARYFIYSLLLRYFLWMAKLPPNVQWGVIIGGYLANRALSSMSDHNPALAPWLWPFRIIYLIFVVLTWTADPLFNLVLRLNRFGRLALSRTQLIASNWVGACMIMALGSLALGIWQGVKSPFMVAALVFGLLIIPMAGVFRCQEGWPRAAMAGYTGLMAVAGGIVIGLLFFENLRGSLPKEFGPILGGLISVFFIGAIASGWVANILIMQQPKR